MAKTKLIAHRARRRFVIYILPFPSGLHLRRGIRNPTGEQLKNIEQILTYPFSDRASGLGWVLISITELIPGGCYE
jgi:hypothetical protein